MDSVYSITSKIFNHPIESDDREMIFDKENVQGSDIELRDDSGEMVTVGGNYH